MMNNLHLVSHPRPASIGLLRPFGSLWFDVVHSALQHVGSIDLMVFCWVGPLGPVHLMVISGCSS